MLKRSGRQVAIVLSALIVSSWAAGAQELNVEGDLAATSFTGDGSNLTGVPDDITHAFAIFNCAAGNTCFVAKDCPANFEVTGGGFFIDSAAQATRAMVTMHQSYRSTPTQWISEATNGSGSALDFYVTVECARVPATMLAPPAAASASALPPGLGLSRVLLVCPESDTARFVDTRDAAGAHFCPNHGLALEASGGGRSEILPAWGAKSEAPAER